MKPIIKMMLPLCVMAVAAVPSVVSASSEAQQAANVKAELQYKICYHTIHNQDCKINDCSKDFWEQLLQGKYPGLGGITKPDTCPDGGETPQPPNDDVIVGPETPDLPTPELPPADEEKPSEPELPPNDDVIVGPGTPDLPTPELPPADQEKPSEPEQKPEEKPEQKPGQDAQLGAYQQKVVDLVNQRRKENGLAPLSVNRSLAKVAEVKASDMRDNNYFTHTSPTYGSPFDMIKQFGISYRAAGENIAKGQKTPETVMDGWMNSEGHRANILNDNYTEIGVGYVTDSNGMTYWVQMFLRP